MKKTFLLALGVVFALGSFTVLNNLSDDDKTKTGGKLPDVKVTTLDGKQVSAKTFSNDGKPMVVNFWATWCSPCKRELNTIHEVYEDWVDETGVKIVAVSIDDARNMHKVKPYADSKGWEYEIYIDKNSDLKRAMGVGNPPMTFLLDGDGNIVYKHSGYSPGDEDELYEEIQKLVE